MIFEPLDAARIRMHLSTIGASLCGAILVLDAVDSTNEHLKRLIRQGVAKTGDICVAEQQTHGKGRRGREWISPKNGNIYLSIVQHVEDDASLEPRLTLALGAIIATTIHGISDVRVGLKWPNDLYIAGRKLGGILVEQLKSDHETYNIVGIGINIASPDPQAFPDVKPIGLGEISGQMVNRRNELIALLTENVLRALNHDTTVTFSRFMETWSELDVALGRPVVVILPNGQRLAGTGAGIDAKGRFKLKTASGEALIDSGEVSLRLA